MPVNTTEAQKSLKNHLVNTNLMLAIHGSIQTIHNKKTIGIDIRKWFSRRTNESAGKDWLPTQKGMWLDYDQLCIILSMLISDSEAIPHYICENDIDKYINKDILNFMKLEEIIEKLS